MAVRLSGSTGSRPSMSSVMEGLVAGARSSRDSTINTLDAVDRQSKAARAQIATTVLEVRASPRPNGARTSAPSAERLDTRFVPEDEWEQPRPTGPVAAPSRARREPHRERPDDEDDNYPETWLR